MASQHEESAIHFNDTYRCSIHYSTSCTNASGFFVQRIVPLSPQLYLLPVVPLVRGVSWSDLVPITIEEKSVD
jgi:hypothetical protein